MYPFGSPSLFYPFKLLSFHLTKSTFFYNKKLQSFLIKFDVLTSFKSRKISNDFVRNLPILSCHTKNNNNLWRQKE